MLPGTHFNIKTVFPGMEVHILKTRRSRDRLIFNIAILILVRRRLYIETAPGHCWATYMAPIDVAKSLQIYGCSIFNWVAETWHHDDVIKWKHFPRHWAFARGIHRSPVNSPHKGQWREALMFSLICALNNGLINNREAGDLRRHRAHYDVILMQSLSSRMTVLFDEIKRY